MLQTDAWNRAISEVVPVWLSFKYGNREVIAPWSADVFQFRFRDRQTLIEKSGFGINTRPFGSYVGSRSPCDASRERLTSCHFEVTIVCSVMCLCAVSLPDPHLD